MDCRSRFLVLNLFSAVFLLLLLTVLRYIEPNEAKSHVACSRSNVTQPPSPAESDDSKNKFWCAWSPKDQVQCEDLLRARLPSRMKQPRRWLFLGDSTMLRLFAMSRIREALLVSPNGCDLISGQLIKGDRCKLNDMFHLPYTEPWVPPAKSMFSGPVGFGLSNPSCNDCKGCDSELVELHLNHSAKNLTVVSSSSECSLSKGNYLYGGYISLEFARDVEIQTPEFPTTQENLAAYIERVWNSPGLLQEWGKPICVLNAGLHDAAIPNITTEIYLRNVKFMFTHLMRACEVIIWLGTSSPDVESEYVQTPALMKTWNYALQNMIESEETFRAAISFIDIHDASFVYPHVDNVHLHKKWYQLLGEFFFRLL